MQRHWFIVLAVCTALIASRVTHPAGPISAKKAPFTVDTLYTGLKNPWGMTWLPDGRALVTERSGEILVFRQDRFTGQKITGLPPVYQNGQGGLMDIILHPQYEKNGWIYISMAKPGPRGGGTAIIRAKLNGNR
ncbi:MAG TPA: PQQ-dependent sugar dehydrogenase, partial [Sphingobacteriaceae bacterium]